MMRKLYKVVIIGLLLIACSNPPNPGKKLYGEWRNVSLKVELNSTQGADSVTIFEADQQNWVKKLGIKPIRTRFKKDGSFTSRYYTPSDSLVMERSGNWEIKNDSLYMYETDPDSTTYIYWYSVQNDTAKFDVMLDWDQDGQKDDHYVGIQHKVEL